MVCVRDSLQTTESCPQPKTKNLICICNCGVFALARAGRLVRHNRISENFNQFRRIQMKGQGPLPIRFPRGWRVRCGRGREGLDTMSSLPERWNKFGNLKAHKFPGPTDPGENYFFLFSAKIRDEAEKSRVWVCDHVRDLKPNFFFHIFRRLWSASAEKFPGKTFRSLESLISLRKIPFPASNSAYRKKAGVRSFPFVLADNAPATMVFTAFGLRRD